MSVDLADFADSLRREVTPLGSTLFADVTDDQLAAYLADAFWEAKLDGFLTGYVADEDGIVTNETSSSADLDRKYVALIVLYAGIRILRNKILNTNAGFRAKAGPVEYEQQNSATVMAEMLKQLRATKDHILDDLDSSSAESTHVMVLDAFSTRLFDSASYWGSINLAG
jgi:hypothetical protein